MEANTPFDKPLTTPHDAPDVLFIDPARELCASRTSTKQHGRDAAPRSTRASVERHVLLSIPEAADYLGISAGTLRNWVSMRRVEHVKVGRLTKISKAVLDRYIADHTVKVQGDAAL